MRRYKGVVRGSCRLQARQQQFLEQVLHLKHVDQVTCQLLC
jgi:hypothetical protein